MYFRCCRTVPWYCSVSVSRVDLSNMECNFFAYNWKLPAYSEAFLLTIDNFSVFTYNWSFFAYNFSIFTYSWSDFCFAVGKCA